MEGADFQEFVKNFLRVWTQMDTSGASNRCDWRSQLVQDAFEHLEILANGLVAEFGFMKWHLKQRVRLPLYDLYFCVQSIS